MTAIFFRFLLTILWELVILVWEFYMLKSNIDVFFCDVISLLALVFIVLSNRSVFPKRCLWKKIVFVIWLYLQKAMYHPCDLDLWPMKVNSFSVNWVQPISILYKFQIDISSNSWEIKYQNIGQTHTHTHRQTDRPGENNTSQPLPGAR